MSCSGGNQNAPVPGLPQTLYGVISSKPPFSTKKPPATQNSSVAGVATCWVCPDGFAFSSPGVTTGLCNGGESYGQGYITFKGTGVKNLASKQMVSVAVTGTLAGGGFNYVGGQWAAKACNNYGGASNCAALFTGPFVAKMTPCPQNDPQCLNQ